jgi:hypothetical protein
MMMRVLVLGFSGAGDCERARAAAAAPKNYFFSASFWFFFLLLLLFFFLVYRHTTDHVPHRCKSIDNDHITGVGA